MPKQSNPTKPRNDRKNRTKVSARAPYNFIPLPDQVINARDPILHNSFEGCSGFIDLTIETRSPTYIRGMLDRQDYEAFGEEKADKLLEEQKEKKSPFFSSSESQVDGQPKPSIPGSSLRGMVRNLVEIISFGHPRWIADEPTFTFRAVAASRDDPLRDPYQDVLGRFGVNVCAGYLRQRADKWFIQPAIKPSDLRLPERGSYLKVKERQLNSRDIPGFVPFNADSYTPNYFAVSFEVAVARGRRGQYAAIEQLGKPGSYRHEGVLVCSGNMLETGRGNQRSPRKNHALILGPQRNAKLLPISAEAIRAYQLGMSSFQREEAWGKTDQGCLEPNAPVFYVEESDDSVKYFGHSPNFRIPAWVKVEDENGRKIDKAATPRDFIPKELLKGAPDLAESLFGWVEEADRQIESPHKQFAGRVFFTDATFVAANDGVWLHENSLVPHVLASPKPTTFQHYLVQDKGRGHDPDQKESLAHYGTSPKETQIRGYKLYWHKGDKPDLRATPEERKHPTQLTRIRPVKAGVMFNGRVHFENLREEELGALLWVLTLPSSNDETYCHKLGMGKPLGMGAVQINASLTLISRQMRYGSLLTEDSHWQTGQSHSDGREFITAFEDFVLKQLKLTDIPFAKIDRIQMLQTMLQWREGERDWLDTTRYMEIERGAGNINEYTQRPVLPDPYFVAKRRNLDQTRVPQRTASTLSPRTKPTSSSSGRRTGTVKDFGLGSNSSFGFIREDGSGEDIFVHKSGLAKGVTTLRRNDRVSFEVEVGLKGKKAVDVQITDNKT